MRRSIVLAGVRPTERMILGHLIEFLKDLIGREAEARCFFMIADYQALRMDREHPRKMESNVRKLVTDLLAAGFDPERSVCFLQSQVPQLAELAMILHYSIPLPAHAGDPEARRKRDAASRSLDPWVWRLSGLSTGRRVAIPAFDCGGGTRSADALESVPGSSTSIQSQIRDRLSVARVRAKPTDEWNPRKYRNTHESLKYGWACGCRREYSDEDE